MSTRKTRTPKKKKLLGINYSIMRKNTLTLPIVALVLLVVACACPESGQRSGTPRPTPEVGPDGRTLPRKAPVEPLEVVSTKLDRGGFGLVAIWKVKIRNVSDEPIGDIVYETQYYSETGNRVGKSDGVIQKIIPPRSTRTFEVNDGAVHSQAARGKFNVTNWRVID